MALAAGRSAKRAVPDGRAARRTFFRRSEDRTSGMAERSEAVYTKRSHQPLHALARTPLLPRRDRDAGRRLAATDDVHSAADCIRRALAPCWTERVGSRARGRRLGGLPSVSARLKRCRRAAQSSAIQASAPRRGARSAEQPPDCIEAISPRRGTHGGVAIRRIIGRRRGLHGHDSRALVRALRMRLRRRTIVVTRDARTAVVASLRHHGQLSPYFR
jgi:hypothetical protein